ncbi:hypothetical protein D3C80_2017710 [compost metagenome]
MLHIPVFPAQNHFPNQYLTSFFTVEGHKFFESTIKNILSSIRRKNNGWEIIKITLDLSSEEFIYYQDQYQVIIPRFFDC